METSFDHRHRPFLNEEDDSGSESPPSAIVIHGSEITTTSIKKPSRKSVQKRVVHVPMKEMEEQKMKREIAVGSNSSFPPFDSWSWRKYGQKPIKGSPYPRAYYRCSSSKGCPARKQVERSRADPATLLVTYCCDHNHANASKNKNQPNSVPEKLRQPMILQDNRRSESEPEPDEKFSDDLGWIHDSILLESPIYVKTTALVDRALFEMREEDESLFADLDELPECSLVYRRGWPVQINDEQLLQFTSPCCGTTS